jgi:hypothetical protein
MTVPSVWTLGSLPVELQSPDEMWWQSEQMQLKSKRINVAYNGGQKRRYNGKFLPHVALIGEEDVVIEEREDVYHMQDISQLGSGAIPLPRCDQ